MRSVCFNFMHISSGTRLTPCKQGSDNFRPRGALLLLCCTSYIFAVDSLLLHPSENHKNILSRSRYAIFMKWPLLQQLWDEIQLVTNFKFEK